MKTKGEPLRITKIQKIIYTKAIVDKKKPPSLEAQGKRNTYKK